MKVLDRLLIPEDRTSLPFGDRYVNIHANQVLVWVSVHVSEGFWSGNDATTKYTKHTKEFTQKCHPRQVNCSDYML